MPDNQFIINTKKLIALTDFVMKTIFISVLLTILAFGELIACDAAALDCIFISSVQVTGDDNFTLCNRCPDPVTLSDMTMIMDSSPGGGATETLAETTIQGLGCVTLFQDVDFDFGFSGGTGETLTLSCPDGSSISVNIPVDPPGGFFEFEPPPVACSGAEFANLTITGANNDDDFIVICNSSCDDIRLDGATVFDSDGPDESETIINQTVPGGGCLTLFRDEAFTFGLGGNDSFTLDCGGTSIFQEWDTDEDQVSFVASACDPAAADAVFILEVIGDDPNDGPDNVTICNNSANLVSLDGATVSDDSGDFPDDGDELFALTIAPFGCITLVNGINFDFGIGGGDDDFIIYCGDTMYDVVPLEDATFMSDAVVPPTKPVVETIIPTMGEWGLISLALLFLIFGTLKLKEEVDPSLA